MWDVGFILEKENTYTNTYVCTRVPVCVCVCTNYQGTENSLPLHLSIPFTYKTKKEMSWDSNSFDCASRSKCGSSF